MPKPIAPTTTIRRTSRSRSLRLPLVGAAVSVLGFGVLMAVYLCKSIFWLFLFSIFLPPAAHRRPRRSRRQAPARGAPRYRPAVRRARPRAVRRRVVEKRNNQKI